MLFFRTSCTLSAKRTAKIGTKVSLANLGFNIFREMALFTKLFGVIA